VPDESQRSQKKILCFSGSTRADSTCRKLLATIAARHSILADFSVYADLSALPHFDPDAEDSSLPEIVADLRRQISEADAVIFCTPEYVFSIPAILKNAIEWCVASTVFSDKPTAMIVASGVGEKTFESLALVLKTMQVQMAPAAMLHLKGARAKINAEGEISDASVLKQLDELAVALVHCCG
jgi:chromate reductase, NAD(P)H dehydrogenase (quinone)